MPTDDQQVLVTGTAPAPAHFTIPGSGQIRPKTIFAFYEGQSSGSPYLPALKITSDGGELIGIYTPCSPVAAGGSAAVTWFPGVDECCPSPPSSGGTIEKITSNGATITVGSPRGPTTNVDLSLSGVTPGTYGDGAHVSQVNVNAEGIVTSASSIAISGTVGGFVKLFDHTLGADTATIDTGANGIPAGYAGLMIYVRGRRTDAVNSGGFGLQFNGDTGTNYDYLWTDNSNGTVTGIVSNTQANTKVMEGPGSLIRANTFGLAQCWLLGYDETNTYKGVTSYGGFSDGGTHGELVTAISSWNSTAAINQITLVVGSPQKILAGSRMTIWGLL